MKLKKNTLMLLICGIFLSACGTNGLYRVTLITEGNHSLSETTFGDLILLGGSATLESGATLEGTAHILAGKLITAGEIRGDISILGGELAFEPGGRATGDLNHGGGKLINLEQAEIVGRINNGTGLQIPAVETESMRDPKWQWIRAVIGATMLGLLALAANRYSPGAVRRVGTAATQHALVSFSMGVLVSVVGISLIVLLAYTILLIPVALLGLGLMGLALLYGWISFGVILANFAARNLKIGQPSRRVVFGSVFAFMLLLNLLTMIPVAGGLLGITSACVSLGAVFLTRFGLRRFIPETAS